MGAASGAAAGTGAQMMTNTEPGAIPSETRITFALRTPISTHQ